MSTFETLLALVVLIFLLSVIVQAIQEVLKSLLNAKADTMAQVIEKFMGTHLSLDQVQLALRERGLDLTALEYFNKEDFRHLLDAIEFVDPQLKGIVASDSATLEQKKDNVAAAYEGARASFQKAYTAKNKTLAIAISFVVVLTLNANLIMLYEELAVDQVMAQAIVGKATPNQCSPESKDKAPSQQSDLATTYSEARDCIKTKLKDYPVLLRSSKRQYLADWTESNFHTILGLFMMGLLVSLGAPFWNDILKGMTGVNNALNTNTSKTS
jgi:hypothetical protein